MKNMARINVVITGACGLLLAAGAVAPAQAWAGSSGGDRITNSDTVQRVNASFRCGPRARFCVNGPLRSGNPRGGDVRISGGSINNSGSPTNTIGNTNSKDETTGPTTKSSNNAQALGGGNTQKAS